MVPIAPWPTSMSIGHLRPIAPCKFTPVNLFFCRRRRNGAEIKWLKCRFSRVDSPLQGTRVRCQPNYPLSETFRREYETFFDKNVALLHILPFVSPFAGKIVGAWCCTAVSVFALSSFIPLVAEVSSVLAAGDLKAFCRKGLLAMLLVTTRSISQFWQDYWLWEVATSATQSLREEMYAKILTADMKYFEGRKNTVLYGDMAFRITQEAESIGDGIFAALHSFVPSILQLGAMVICMVRLSPLLTVSTLCVVPSMAAVISVLGEKVRIASRQGQDTMASLTGYLNEILPSIALLKAFSAEQYERTRFHHLAARDRQARMSKKLLKALFPHAITAAYSAALLSLFAASSWAIGRGSFSAAQLLSFLTSLVMLLEPLQAVGTGVNEIKQSQAAAERVMELSSWDNKVKEVPEAAELTAVEGFVQLDRVSFRYDVDQPGDTLHRVSLSVSPGETVALVGPSGGGKSTVFKLILRLYDPTEGRVLVDGRDIRGVSLSSLRSHMGVVLQDSVLFSGTVAENIAYGQLGHEQSMPAIREAARLANAVEFIEAMPAGFHTSLGERGLSLSGGQRQRLAIARALYRNPSILLLDEATSALDNQSELLVREALERLLKGKTALIIAHRPETIALADRVVFLRDGCVVEEGSLEQLVALNGEFAAMFPHQFAVASD